MDLLVATQIAYYDFNINIIRDNNYSATLQELFKQDKSIERKIQDSIDYAKLKGSALEVTRLEKAKELI
ncbi:hypothetical protein SAMN05444401_1929 [Clostridium amylolyticum]|uniref:Uncharacterized protein n=2 Tax=Clostridium amylolyticum TaxID=1121298 RepID=A0A1M6FFW5_9CLOT|nr:hypothetical protein SAMN05444401_1929 [Clostridium amylolyticum]